MRGKRESYAADGENERITPACAGKTRYAIIAIIITEDHPRVCGENNIDSEEVEAW